MTFSGPLPGESVRSPELSFLFVCRGPADRKACVPRGVMVGKAGHPAEGRSKGGNQIDYNGLHNNAPGSEEAEGPDRLPGLCGLWI